jgi:serine/threonine protein kinase
VLTDPRPAATGGRADLPARYVTAYTAPEQLTVDSQLDRRCDVYAIGAMLVVMASGHPPRRTSAGAGPPRIPRTPSRPLDALVRRALAVDPRRRPSSCLELAEALRSIGQRLDQNTLVAASSPDATAPNDTPTPRRTDPLARAVRSLLPVREYRTLRRAPLISRPTRPPRTTGVPTPLGPQVSIQGTWPDRTAHRLTTPAAHESSEKRQASSAVELAPGRARRLMLARPQQVHQPDQATTNPSTGTRS